MARLRWMTLCAAGAIALSLITGPSVTKAQNMPEMNVISAAQNTAVVYRCGLISDETYIRAMAYIGFTVREFYKDPDYLNVVAQARERGEGFAKSGRCNPAVWDPPMTEAVRQLIEQAKRLEHSERLLPTN